MEGSRQVSGPEASKRLIVLLLCILFLAHVVYYLLGIRFDDSLLKFAPQYLDPKLLSDRLIESCVYMHMQPPLFNFYLGAVLKLSAEHSTHAYQGISILGGAILCVAMFLSLISLRVRKSIAAALTALFVVSPSFMLYEHMLFYTFPAAVLLCLSVFLLYRFLKSGSSWVGFSFFFGLFLLSGIRSVFHLMHYCVVVLILLVLVSRLRRRVLLTAILPFLLIASFSVKNLVLFDHFSATTWSGLNLWIFAVRQMPLSERENLVSQGEISEVSLLKPLSPLWEYPERYRDSKGFEAIPVLRQIKKSNGAVNYNHLSYIAISDQYGKDARRVLAQEKKYAVLALAKNWYDYFKSSSHHGFLRPNLDRASPVTKIYDHLFFGKLPLGSIGRRLIPSAAEGHGHIYLFLLLGLPLVLIHGIICASRDRAFGLSMGHTERVLLLYICFNIVYVAMLVNTFGFDENNRYRFMTDPLYLILLGILAEHVVSRFVSKPNG